jgi:LuxR family transcriptional regulator, regulator of acetate metabolism
MLELNHARKQAPRRVSTALLGSATKPATGAGPDAQTLLGLQRQLHRPESIPDLFRLACSAAREWCGFSRTLVVSIVGDELTANLVPCLDDGPSDAMRRKLLARPVQLGARSAEAEAIRVAEGGQSLGDPAVSQLALVLGLRDFALGVVMPEDRVLALLVVDRDDSPVEPSDRNGVQLVAHVVAAALLRLVLRKRMQEFAAELRHLTVSAQALMKEGNEAPLTLPSNNGAGLVFSLPFPASLPSGRLCELFTERELSIVRELAAGRSNPEIAAKLQISIETVKTYVVRVMRKLGASNRAEAAVRYLQLTSGGSVG